MILTNLPQEIIDRIIDEIALDTSTETQQITSDLKTLSLTSSKLHPRSRTHLFRTLEITSISFPSWCKDVRPGRDGPSRFVAHLRYHPASSETERITGPSEDSFTRNPSHLSAFTNLRTLHLVEISLKHAGYLTSFGRLSTNVRELWLEDCEMDISQFVSFLRPFANLERLRLIRPQCHNENKLQVSDMADPPPLKRTLEYHQPDMASSRNIPSFIRELSLLPATFHTIVFRDRLETPTGVNRLLAASRNTLTKLTFGHNSQLSAPLTISHTSELNPPFSAIPKGINLKPLEALQELELGTFVVGPLPRVLSTIRSSNLENIRFLVLVHELEEDVDYSTRNSWHQLDFELCALVNRSHATKSHNGANLQVKVSDSNPATPAWSVDEIARLFFPRAYDHSRISFSVG